MSRASKRRVERLKIPRRGREVPPFGVAEIDDALSGARRSAPFAR